MANKNTINKKHDAARTAQIAKAGKRAHHIAPPEMKVNEAKAKWIAAQVINGIMGYDDALNKVRPNALTQQKVEEFLTHMAHREDVNPVVKLRITRYL